MMKKKLKPLPVIRKKKSERYFSENAHPPFFSPALQPKLSLSARNDIYENKADAVADQIMSMPNNNGKLQTTMR